MKYILLVIMSGIIWSSCQDITIGFLKTENADYGYDTLIVRKVLDENLDYERIQNKAPAGTYKITLKVSNEGYTHFLPDIFTFIIE